MTIDHNPAGWIEIPVTDMNRAQKFYSTVFEYELTNYPVPTMPDMQMMLFPYLPNTIGAGVALVQHPIHVPAPHGPLVYLTAFSGDCAVELGRVVSAGGTVVQEKQSIGENGCMGVFIDTEGNALAVHSKN